MNRCSDCGALQPPGVLFCDECGAALPAAQRSPAASGTPWHYVHVLVSGVKQQWRLALHGPLWIGRADPEDGFWPQVDLTAADGAALGVSRRHAAIDFTDQGPVLIDKNSVNGTWIDEEQLAPQRPYVLQPLTLVRFGRLRARLILE